MSVTRLDCSARAVVAVVAVAVVVVGSASCIDDARAIERLPIASLACPSEVEAGAEFVIDGSESTPGDGGLVETTLSVAGESSSTLSSTFTAPSAPGVVTARLVVVDTAGHVAEARCRIVVVEGGPIDPGPGPDAGPDVEDPVDVDINGRFAVVAYDRPVLEDSDLEPDRQCTDSPVLALVELDQDEGSEEVSMRWTYCAIVWPEVTAWFGLQQAEWSSSCVDALPSVSSTFTREGDALAPKMTELGVGSVVGARVDDDTALPTSANDPSVSDDDNDGWPAVTLRSSTFAEDVVYRRFIRELSGTVVDQNTIAGTYRADTEASLVSWRDFMVPAGPGRASTFHMTRVDDGFTCGDVRYNADTLLAEFPAPVVDDCP